MFSRNSGSTMASAPLLVLLVAQVTFALTACREDSTGTDDDEMTQAEANAFVQGLFGGNLLVYGSSLIEGDSRTVTTDPPAGAVPLDATTPCTGGGQAVFQGEARFSQDDAQGAAGIELSGTLVADGCTFTGDEVTFTLDADPGLAQSISFTTVPEEFSFSLKITVSGFFSWTNGQRSGSCSLDTTVTSKLSPVDAALSGSVPTAKVSGSVCGLNVDREISLGTFSI